MSEPFPPRVIITLQNGQEALCDLRDVMGGVPRYDLPCPDCGGTAEPPTRLEADTARAMDLIGKAFRS